MSQISKQNAAIASVNYIENGMTIGLGSGTTMYYCLQELGRLIQAGFDIKGVPTSKKTEKWAAEFGIPLIEMKKQTVIDLAIDGADHIDDEFHLLKGGGGSLVREKIVAAAARTLIIVIDDTKNIGPMRDLLLPVEILPFGWEKTAMRIEELGYTPILRYKQNEVFVSDNGNYVVDCSVSSLNDPSQAHLYLKALTGVVDTGLFINMADRVIIGSENDVTVQDRQSF